MPSGSAAVGLAFDTNGNLYAADSALNQISQISPDGLTVSTFATGIPSPTFIAIVPEPGSALVGVLLLGVATARRRRTA